ncbi:hypothetical protein F2P56_032437, partial [Juglans regia]
LASKGIKHKKNINEKCRRDQNHQRPNRSESIQTPTSQYPQLDLNQIHQRHHQEPAPENRPDGGYEYPKPQRGHVKVPHGDDKRLAAAKDPGFPNFDGLLEGQGDKAGEEEGAEGVHVVSHEVFGDVGPGSARFVGADERGGESAGGVPREAEEERQGEKRIGVDDAV